MNKQMKLAREKTLDMFRPDEVKKATDSHSVPKWYYVTRNRDTEMMISIDVNGRAVWVAHDLQYTIPHMFNTAHMARKTMAKVGGHDVRMSKYQVIDGKSVWEAQQSQ